MNQPRIADLTVDEFKDLLRETIVQSFADLVGDPMSAWCCEMTSPKSCGAPSPRSTPADERQPCRRSRAGSIRPNDL